MDAARMLLVLTVAGAIGISGRAMAADFELCRPIELVGRNFAGPSGC